MSQPADQPRRYTIAEYLALEEAATEKHEFHDGEIIAAGTWRSPRTSPGVRARIVENLARALRSRASASVAVERDASLTTTPAGRSLIADVLVTETRRQTPVDRRQAVVEVTSTEADESGDQFAAYRAVPSVDTYVVVTPYEPHVRTFHRNADRSWRVDFSDGLDAIANLRSLSIELPLAEVYLNVTFPPPGPPRI